MVKDWPTKASCFDSRLQQKVSLYFKASGLVLVPAQPSIQSAPWTLFSGAKLLVRDVTTPCIAEFKTKRSYAFCSAAYLNVLQRDKFYSTCKFTNRTCTSLQRFSTLLSDLCKFIYWND